MGAGHVMKKLFLVIMMTPLIILYPAPSRAETPIPGGIIERADKYIISKVGKDYFKQNYRFLEEESLGNKGNPLEYFLYYDYLPATKLAGETVKIFVRMSESPDYVPWDYVACVNKGKICEPKITKKQALEIVAAQKIKEFSEEKAEISFGMPNADKDRPGWFWEIAIPIEQGRCGTTSIYHVVRVDAITGEYRYLRESKIASDCFIDLDKQ